MTYYFKTELDLGFEEAVAKAKEELKKEGFGILTEIDVKKTMKEKLGVEHDDYLILGACNPSFASKVLKVEKEIGLLLPCNVIVYRENGKTVVSAVNPVEAMSMVENESLKEIAEEVAGKLGKVIKEVENG
jgi:uncharacterized protein (DUF302 family)